MVSDLPLDPDLRAAFAQLKRADAAAAPQFAELLSRARAEAAQPGTASIALGDAQRRLWRLRRIGWVGGLAAAAALVLLLANPRERAADAAFERAVQAFTSDPALGAWRSPTDALLKVPGSRLISTVPSIDVPAMVPGGSR